MSGTEFLEFFLQPFSFTPKAEGSQVAKPRPMNLVSRNLLIAKKDPPQDSSDPNSIRNQELDQSSVSSSGRKLTRNINQNPTMCSQESQNKMTLNLPAPGNWGREMNLQAQPAPGNWSGHRNRRVEDGIPQYENLRPSIYLEKVFKNFRKKLNLVEKSPIIYIEALKNNVLIWRFFMSTTTEAATHLGPNYVEILEVVRNTNFEELQN